MFASSLIVLTKLVSPEPLVHISQPIRVESPDSFWTILAGFSTVAVALATIGLALYTSRLAKATDELVKKTADSLDVARQALENDKAAQAIARQALDNERSARADEVDRHKDGFMPHIALRITEGLNEFEPGIRSSWTVLYATNIGVGLAQNIRAAHANQPANGIIVNPPPTALGVGQEVMLCRRAHHAPTQLVGYTLTYRDVFDREFETTIGNDIRPSTPYTWRQIK